MQEIKDYFKRLDRTDWLVIVGFWIISLLTGINY